MKAPFILRTTFLLALFGLLFASMITPASGSYPSVGGGSMQLKRRHRHHHHHLHVDKRPMTISAPVSGGGALTIHLRWIGRHTMFEESVSVSHVPATCTELAENGEEFIVWHKPLEGSQLVDLPFTIPSELAVRAGGFFGVSSGIEISVQYDHYDSADGEFSGVMAVEENELCLSGLELGWTTHLPHGWP
jgi:hypothetical protein